MRKGAGRLLIWLAYLGLACRVVVPAGYMPAPLADGGPIVLCHGGAAGQVLSRLGELAGNHHSEHGDQHRDHHPDTGEDGSGVHDAWEICPLGKVLTAAAITAEFTLHTLELSEPAPATEPRNLTAAVTHGAYWARAPPLSLSHVV
jgi:hypothetical protein